MLAIKPIARAPAGADAHTLRVLSLRASNQNLSGGCSPHIRFRSAATAASTTPASAQSNLNPSRPCRRQYATRPATSHRVWPCGAPRGGLEARIAHRRGEVRRKTTSGEPGQNSPGRRQVRRRVRRDQGAFRGFLFALSRQRRLGFLPMCARRRSIRVWCAAHTEWRRSTQKVSSHQHNTCNG